MKVLFIVNPAAGKGTAVKQVDIIRSVMIENRDVDYKIEYTEKPGHATQIAKYSAADNTDIIFAVGGDGTVNEVINGVIGTKSALGIIPAGSGNDFIRSLGVTGDIKGIISNTINGTRKTIDMGIVNGRYFANISSVGFDADVVLATQKVKRYFLSGSAAYVVGLISTIFTRKSDNVKMVLDDGEIKRRVLLIAVANGKYYGGGMMAAPDAVLDDGLFDICCIEHMSKLKMLFLFPQFIKGKHKKFKEVSFFRTKKVYIEVVKPISINIDGEVYSGTSASFEIVKDALIVSVPQSAV